ncbi:MAG: IS1380 family transposase [Gemmatimonadetes bacterium]|uniref:IS1380 family transposase n=1 Tax=Candidatus Kutchimonas denitrificans TaxID=3056748 RepID=A0AAE4ZAD3_9BACT|nr:IS1380 family transposase [Candidatus Kutchimonas denitrificans]NIU51672.1 IS1380 family transposase [Gemmatimonadota bacterium]NIY43669.1 IS1380 family transposase [Gemmatimonadota bacterium]
MIIPETVERRKRSIERRLNGPIEQDFTGPMFAASNIQYELADRTRAVGYGGIGLVHKLARQAGLIDAIDRRLHLLKIHLPYHESDHVLNLAYNALCDGRCLEDIELRRNDETFLDALGTQRIPDPTTAGDFCRRFHSAGPIRQLEEAIDEARLNVWSKQPEEFFEQAIIDMDGHLVGTTGECKQGMDVAYNGTWGYHPLIVSLANTGEVLSILNRPGNRPSHEGAAGQCDRAIALCRRAGFRKVLLRGDTDFSQTEHLDRWDEGGVTFQFGYDAKANLEEIADDLPKTRWKKLKRPPRYQVRTRKRRRPDRIKAKIVHDRGFEVLSLESEEVAEFDYRPTKCKKTYRMVVVRKNISRERGERRLFDEVRYFFYITNDRESTPAEVVFSCNDRCDQENLIEQLKNGVRALRAPVDNLFSNWAYMVMTGLAWNLKAWWALRLPEKGRWATKHRAEKQALLNMDFRTFVHSVMKIPCQIIRTGRRLIYRLLGWNPWLPAFRRLAVQLNC